MGYVRPVVLVRCIAPIAASRSAASNAFCELIAGSWLSFAMRLRTLQARFEAPYFLLER
jgi:hypothetical protein